MQAQANLTILQLEATINNLTALLAAAMTPPPPGPPPPTPLRPPLAPQTFEAATLTVVANLDVAVEDFDASAQQTYKEALAATAGGGITAADITLIIASGSLKVEATIRTPSERAAREAAVGVSAAINSTAMSGTFMGLAIVETPTQSEPVVAVLPTPSPPPVLALYERPRPSPPVQQPTGGLTGAGLSVVIVVVVVLFLLAVVVVVFIQRSSSGARSTTAKGDVEETHEGLQSAQPTSARVVCPEAESNSKCQSSISTSEEEMNEQGCVVQGKLVGNDARPVHSTLRPLPRARRQLGAQGEGRMQAAAIPDSWPAPLRSPGGGGVHPFVKAMTFSRGELITTPPARRDLAVTVRI